MLKFLAFAAVVVGVVLYGATRPSETGDTTVFNPSPLTLLAMPQVTDYEAGTYTPYQGDLKVLVVATEDRNMKMTNGKFFHTGNHPIEFFLPILHMLAAGFEVEIATPSGKPVVFEDWALPLEDEAVMDLLNNKLNAQLANPLSFDTLSQDNLDGYAGVFLPGGHGAMLVLEHKEQSQQLGDVLRKFMNQDKVVITLCHGPGLLLSATTSGVNPFDGYSAVSFPDFFDINIAPVIGYLPGNMPWALGERLQKEAGITLLNADAIAPDGSVHRDRYLVTGDSPDASNAVGKLGAATLLEWAGAQ